MKKCVKIILAPIRSCERFLGHFKKTVNLSSIEGVVECDNGEIEVVLHGNLEEVNSLIGTIEECAIRYNIDHNEEILFAVEPCAKTEDFRGVVRFLRREGLLRGPQLARR